MAWGVFAIALLLAYLLQTGVTAMLQLTYFDPFLLLALLCGLLAPTPQARIACWCTGLLQDLGSTDALGVHAFTLGLTGLFLTQLRELGNIGVWWARGLFCFLAAWPGLLIYLLHLHYWAGRGQVTLWSLTGSATLTTLVAAGLAMLICGLPRMLDRKHRRRGYRVQRG